jgi:hypothetical protein
MLINTNIKTATKRFTVTSAEKQYKRTLNHTRAIQSTPAKAFKNQTATSHSHSFSTSTQLAQHQKVLSQL